MNATVDSSIPVVASENAHHNYTPWLVVLTVLLTISILLNGYMIFSIYQQNRITAQRVAIYNEQVQEATNVINAQQSRLLTIVESYESVAYGDNVDRIAEQQLIATEYTMELLQAIAIQNTQIISLLATLP